MAATWEEASRCPRCDQAGEAGVAQQSRKPGVKVIPVFCRNEHCRWFDTSWLVQINPDGSIPDAAPTGTARGEKQFGSENLLTAGVTDQLIERVNREAAGMDQPGKKELGSR